MKWCKKKMDKVDKEIERIAGNAEESVETVLGLAAEFQSTEDIANRQNWMAGTTTHIVRHGRQRREVIEGGADSPVGWRSASHSLVSRILADALPFMAFIIRHPWQIHCRMMMVLLKDASMRGGMFKSLRYEPRR